VDAELVAAPDPGIFAVLRRHALGPMLGLYNITETPRAVPGWWIREQGMPAELTVDALNGYPPNLTADGSIWLSTYQPVWLVRR
jgi:amylosucrase